MERIDSNEYGGSESNEYGGQFPHTRYPSGGSQNHQYQFLQSQLGLTFTYGGDQSQQQTVFAGSNQQQTFTSNNPPQAYISENPPQAFTDNYPPQAFFDNIPPQAFIDNNPPQAYIGENPLQAFTDNNLLQAYIGNNLQQAFTGYDPSQAYIGNNSQQAFTGNNPERTFANQGLAPVSQSEIRQTDNHIASEQPRQTEASSAVILETFVGGWKQLSKAAKEKVFSDAELWGLLKGVVDGSEVDDDDDDASQGSADLGDEGEKALVRRRDLTGVKTHIVKKWYRRLEDSLEGHKAAEKILQAELKVHRVNTRKLRRMLTLARELDDESTEPTPKRSSRKRTHSQAAGLDETPATQTDQTHTPIRSGNAVVAMQHALAGRSPDTPTRSSSKVARRRIAGSLHVSEAVPEPTVADPEEAVVEEEKEEVVAEDDEDDEEEDEDDEKEDEENDGDVLERELGIK